MIEINTKLDYVQIQIHDAFVCKVFYETNDVQMKATQMEEYIICFNVETLGKLMKSSLLKL